MKKVIFILLISLCLPQAFGSKLSKFLNKIDAEDKARKEREWRQDMNFSDLSFRLERRFGDQFGQQCREYEFRSRSNPYRHGHYKVCEERGGQRHGHDTYNRHGHGSYNQHGHG